MKPICREKTIWMTVDISSETMEARRKWHNIFQVLKENDSQTPNVISTRIIFQKWNKNNDILKEKLRKLMAIKITLKERGNSWNTKEIIKNLRTSGMKSNRQSKIMYKCTRLSPPEFLKLWLMFEAKSVTLSNMVPIICRRVT